MATSKNEIQAQLGRWRDTAVGPYTGGLHLDIDPELIEENQFANSNNAVVTYRELQSDAGSVIVGQTGLRGDPRCVVDFIDPTSNGGQRICITNTTVYKWDPVALQWQYVSNGTETTLTVAAAGGATALTVASIAGFANGEFVGVRLDTGAMHFATVNGAPAGSIVTITPALPSGAAIGRQLIESVALVGAAANHVTAMVIPWSGQVVFTNTQANNVKIWTSATGLNGACIDLTGTGLPANMKCNSLALYDSSLILIGCNEAGTLRLSRFRYCAKGDLTLWNTLEAGSTDLLENFGEIRQGLALGPHLILYRKRGISRVSIGGGGRFTTDAAIPLDGGVLSSLAAVDLVDKHIFLDAHAMYWYRGGFSIEKVECPIKKSIWGPVGVIKSNFLSAANMFLLPLGFRDEVILAYGTAGLNNPRFHIGSGVWTTRAISGGGRFSGYGEAIQSSAGSIGTMFFCEGNADKVLLYDQVSTTDDGASIFFSVDTKDFSHKSLMLETDFIEIKASGSGTLVISYSLDAGVNVTTWGTCALTAVPTRFRLHKQLTVQKIRFRFSSTSPVTIHFYNLRHQFVSEQ